MEAFDEENFLLCRIGIFPASCFVSCGSSSSKTGGANSATPTPAAASSGSSDVQPQSPKAEIDPCSLFSPADAQAITGVPMKLAPGHGAIVCMYEETSPKPGHGHRACFSHAQRGKFSRERRQGMEEYERDTSAQAGREEHYQVKWDRRRSLVRWER